MRESRKHVILLSILSAIVFGLFLAARAAQHHDIRALYASTLGQNCLAPSLQRLSLFVFLEQKSIVDFEDAIFRPPLDVCRCDQRRALLSILGSSKRTTQSCRDTGDTTERSGVRGGPSTSRSPAIQSVFKLPVQIFNFHHWRLFLATT